MRNQSIPESQLSTEASESLLLNQNTEDDDHDRKKELASQRGGDV